VSDDGPLHLFEGFGVELEYMVVADDSLDTRPVVDELLRAAAGTDEYVSDVEFGTIAWSNELVLHVLELKTNGPAAALEGLDELFHANVRRANELLAAHGARLLPTGMHPWMDPFAEMRLWPHENSPIYEAFNRVFDCRGHGWANLQSVHLNLPFADDAEFGRLHAAIRLLLPLLPGLAASSPIADGRLTGDLDHRLEVYRHNARRVPAVSGRVIPEPAFDRAAYDRLIFEPLFRDIAPLDPGGVLQEEFLNARGAIARFTRHAIEIRVLDVQECPARDLAVCAGIVAVLKRLVAEDWSPLAAQQAVEI
jgi:glutamate---cysteine ligase / carboxylate-amine ligase